MIGGMMRWRKITPNPKRRNCGNSHQILEHWAWLVWGTFLLCRGPRRNVPSLKTRALLSFLPVQSFVLPRPDVARSWSPEILMGLNARQSEIFKEFKCLSLSRMKPFCICMKFTGGRTRGRMMKECQTVRSGFPLPPLYNP